LKEIYWDYRGIQWHRSSP